MQPAIRVDGLSRSFGDTVAVDRVSFSVERGEVFAFLGPNGAGKTTIVRMLTGVLSPTSGTAAIMGCDIRKQPLQSRAASAVGPLVTPWERTARTYERLISTPLGVPAILAGDVLSGFLFGIVISSLPVALGLLLTEAAMESGLLLAAPPVRGPSNIMLLSNLVRLPLIFVSGVFVPLAEMPAWVRGIAPLSPLSYGSAAVRTAFGQTTWLSPGLSLAMLPAYSAVLFALACIFHSMGRSRGL